MRCSLLFLLGCAGSNADDTSATVPDDSTQAPMQAQFSFAVFADPHLTDTAIEHEERLAAAVEWVNTQPEIELVVVVGDIGWSGGLPIAKALLDQLDAPYLPVLGDNEVHLGAEQTFNEVFTDQYDLLATLTDDFRRGPIEVYNPEWEFTSWFQNMSFGYRGLRFVGLDWCSRDEHPLFGEMADLHDFDGGTFPWFTQEIGSVEAGADENVLLFSHHPMFLSPGAFDIVEMDQISAVTYPLEDRIAAAWAGHYHVTWDQEIPTAGYSIHITDATWDDENTVRVVHVSGNGKRFSFEQELIVIAP